MNQALTAASVAASLGHKSRRPGEPSLAAGGAVVCLVLGCCPEA